MIPLRAIKISGIGALGLATMSLGAHGYVSLERYAATALENTYNGLIADLALQAGFERPQPPMLPATREEIIAREARRYGINPSLLRANISIESNGDPYAISDKGAIGLGQIMPANIKLCGLKHKGQLFSEEHNIACSAKILAMNLKQWPNPLFALQAYNGGDKCVNRCEESINHARKVLSRWAKE